MSKYAAFFAAYKASVAAGNPNTKEEVISSFTNGRTSSLKELDPLELHQLVQMLNKAAGASPITPDDLKADKMRKAVISIFYQMGHTPAEAKAWAEKQGVKRIKKPFNDYTTGELHTLIRVAEKALRDQQLAIRKSLLIK